MDRRRHDRGAAGKLPARRGGDFVVVASGPSLAEWQTDYIRDKARAIATNTSFRRIAPGQTVYGCDGAWWDRYHDEAAAFECWTQDAGAAVRYGLNWIKATHGKGLSVAPGVIHQGANSGYQAINLAWHMGAERIILIGFDMKKSKGLAHWHGDHPTGLGNATGVERWARNFDALAADLRDLGVPVVNCTIDTALTCFEQADLRDVL